MSKIKDLTVLNCKVTIPISEEEAHEYLKNKRGKVAKELRTYMCDLLEAMCKKCLKVAEEERIKNAVAPEEEL